MKKLIVILLFGIVFLNNTYSQEYFPFSDINRITLLGYIWFC